jgi:predicted transcriptional regulator
MSSEAERRPSPEPGSAPDPSTAPAPDTAAARAQGGAPVTLTDAKAMRAVAHPVRMALIELFGYHETLTATQASDLLGESPANCAFHLRTLAKYGFVEEAGGGRGRERPWRLRYRGLELAPPWQDTETRLAAHAVASIWIDRWLARARDRLMRIISYPPAWQEATLASQMDLYLTAQEAKDLGAAMHELVKPYQPRRDDPSLRPPGHAHFELMLFGYPLDEPDDPAQDSGAAGPSDPATPSDPPARS